MKHKSIKNQLSTFVPEVVLFFAGVVFLFLMVWEFPLAYSFLKNVEQFNQMGTVTNLTLFYISLGLTFGIGLALLNVSLYGFKFYDKQLNYKWPSDVAFGMSAVLFVSAITFLILFLII